MAADAAASYGPRVNRLSLGPIALAVALACGCGPAEWSPSELGKTRVFVANDRGELRVALGQPEGSCAPASDRLLVTLDGVPLTLADRGAWAEATSIGNPEPFRICTGPAWTGAPPRALATSVLELREGDVVERIALPSPKASFEWIDPPDGQVPGYATELRAQVRLDPESGPGGFFAAVCDGPWSRRRFELVHIDSQPDRYLMALRAIGDPLLASGAYHCALEASCSQVLADCPAQSCSYEGTYVQAFAKSNPDQPLAFDFTVL